MKGTRPHARATITPKGERALLAGHPWVYEAEVERLEPATGAVAGTAGAAGIRGAADAPDAQPPAADSSGCDIPNGSLVDVLSRKGAYLGTALISHRSKIRLRLITRNANDRFDAAFWRRKVQWAWDYRVQAMGKDATDPEAGCRIVFGEADGFPGLVVDRFADVLVTQTLTVGMERLKSTIFPLLREVLAASGVAIRGIYERNDVSIRKLEGLEETCGWFAPAAGPGSEGLPPGTAGAPDAAGTPGPAALAAPTFTQIIENGVRYHVDFEHGQKTGFFLDQKYNRAAVARLARGRRVLDCFTHTGSFALNAAAGGAKFVRAVDVSELAIAQARENAQLNGLEDKMAFTAANVFDLLPQLEGTRDERYDFIILDPPAFTKSRKTIDAAAHGYKEINYRALRLLPRGGYLATCSCSHFMDVERFRRMMVSAAHDAGVQLRQIEERQQAPDHPIVWGISETDYLKFFLFQVV